MHEGLHVQTYDAEPLAGQATHEGAMFTATQTRIYTENLTQPAHLDDHPLHNQMGQARLRRCKSKGQSETSVPWKETRDRWFGLRGSVC